MSTVDADCVRVAIRIRPLVTSEITRGCQNVLYKSPHNAQIIIGGNKSNELYTFNHVFTSEDTQSFVYESAIQNMIDKLFKGFNVTILAYGQTGSGKTYTMGTTHDGNDSEDMGVIPRAVTDIFDKMENLSDDYEFTITCSFMELYQEQLYDLLCKQTREHSIVDIREDLNKGIIIPGLTEIPVTTIKETTECLIKGSSGRAVGATAMNAQSSRSHAIFTLTLQMMKKNDTNSSTTSRFHLVDLAGSERSKKTEATGVRFKEGVKINQGLLALGNVISALGSGTNNGYVSYRDSKLTRLLQDSLGGNSVTLMIACVSPADYNLEETQSTLRYADRAKKIKNKPIVNQDPRAAEINRLNSIIQKLRLELLNKDGGTHNGCGDSFINSEDINKLRIQNNFLFEKNRVLQQQLQSTLHDVANIEMRAVLCETNNEDLQKKIADLKNIITELNSTFNQETCPAEFVIHSKSIHNIKQMVEDIDGMLVKNKDELQVLHTSTSNETERFNSRNSLNSNEEINNKLEKFTEKQIGLNNELRKMNADLAIKEELHQKLLGNLSNFCSYEGDQNSETKIKDYEAIIISLEKEKDDLNDKLKCVKTNITHSKLAEERRKRVQHLEQEIMNMKKKNLQQSKLLKMKEKDSQRIVNLTTEIQAIKAAKVKLVRSMKTESENFRQWKLNREKELCQLREKDRKRENEMARMATMHIKQQNVLRRKVEEATAINKRLKDVLERQRNVQTMKKTNTNGKTEQAVNLLDQELEIMLSVIDAKISLEQLMEDRGTLNQRLIDMKNNENADPKEVDILDEDIQLRNAQISDLQQKIISSDVEGKTKNFVEGLQSMPEARAAIKHLFNAISEIRKTCSFKENKFDELKAINEEAEDKISTLEAAIETEKDRYKEKVNCIEKSYSEKITVLLRELNKMPQNESGIENQYDEKQRIQEEVLDEMDELREQLEKYKEECEKLRNANAFKKPKRIINRITAQLINAEDDIMDTDDDPEPLDDSLTDPDWLKSHLKNSRQTRSNTSHDSDKSVDKTQKRSSDGLIKCSCKGNCSTRICSCRKKSTTCSAQCKCSIICANKNANDYENENDDSTDKMENKENNETYIKPYINDDIVENTPKKQKLSIDRSDITTPVYPYSKKPKTPFYNDI